MRGRRHDLELTISTIANTRAHSFVRSSSSSSSLFDMQAYKNKGKTRRKKKVALRRREAEAAEREATDVVADDQSDDDDGLPPHPAGESAIISMTADFAMQNVILQMGLVRAVKKKKKKKKKNGTGSSLMMRTVIVGSPSDDAISDPDHDARGHHDDRHRDDELTHRWPTPPTPTPTPLQALAAPDGKEISSVSRFVLRCTACNQVTKEMGRVFCPKCGNATLDRVKITTGADGAELVGVRRKHILRGTKFSLPKPKGGRNYGPIMREDELLTKKHLLRAKKAGAKAQLDPFAPEFTDETWVLNRCCCC